MYDGRTLGLSYHKKKKAVLLLLVLLVVRERRVACAHLDTEQGRSSTKALNVNVTHTHCVLGWEGHD